MDGNRRDVSERRRALPKRREDLQVLGVRVDSAIERGQPEVLPIYRRSSLFVITASRQRFTPVYDGEVKGVNNLMTISAGSILDSRWIVVGKHSPLRRYLHLPSSVLREKWDIYFRDGVPHVRIYQVIDGMAFAERKRVHMLATYQKERSSLEHSRRLFQARLEDVRTTLTGRERIELLAALRSIERRQEDILAILSDRAAREVGLHAAFVGTQTRLFEMAANLQKIAGLARRNPNLILGSVKRITDQYRLELAFYNSKEIRPLIRSVRTAFSVLSVAQERYAWRELGYSLDKDAQRLLEAALTLQQQAENLEPKEVATARELSLVGI